LPLELMLSSASLPLMLRNISLWVTANASLTY